MESNRTPFVSVIIPCRNEDSCIRRCLDSIVNGTYPTGKLEILVVDGMSDDKTMLYVNEYIKQFPCIRVLKNERKITPYALNIGILESKGKIIVRLDAHAIYANNYIARSVEALQKYSADMVGGIRRIVPRQDGFLGRSLAHLTEYVFAAGHPGAVPGRDVLREVDTIFCGCYRREIFQRIGLFNVDMVRAQDREFSHRVKEAGGKIVQTSDLECTYFVRSGLREYCQWIFQSGLWPVLGSRISGRQLFRWRNSIPALCLLAGFGIVGLTYYFPPAWFVIFGGGIIYLGASLALTWPLYRREGDSRYLIVVPVLLGITFFFYALGSLYGLLKSKPVVNGGT